MQVRLEKIVEQKLLEVKKKWERKNKSVAYFRVSTNRAANILLRIQCDKELASK